jgi:hypoxanthine phosphoribosyltransferase
MKSTPKDLKLLLSKEEIEDKIKTIAKEINKDYKDKKPLLIGILKGSFVFMADLIRHLSIGVEISFAELSSYYDSTKSTGEVEFIKEVGKNITQRDIIIIEDIIDTGITLSTYIKHLEEKNPSSIKVCTLTSKPARRKKKVKIDYLGFEIPDKFIVGYGIDYNEQYRNLPALYYLEQ